MSNNPGPDQLAINMQRAISDLILRADAATESSEDALRFAQAAAVLLSTDLGRAVAAQAVPAPASRRVSPADRAKHLT